MNNDNSINAQMSSVLALDLELKSGWVRVPCVYIVPHNTNSENFFLMIWVYLDNALISLPHIWSVLKRIISLFCEKHFLDGMLGAEIVLSVAGKNTEGAQRILRLSFFSRYVEALIANNDSILLAGDIIPDGARCSWYVNPKEIF